MSRRGRVRLLAASLFFFALSPLSLCADELGDLFQTPTTDAPPQQTSQASSLLTQYQQTQRKLSYSFNLVSAAGTFQGWAAPPDFSSPWPGFSHTYVGGIVMTPAVDLRPLEYLRIHGSLALTYPNATGDALGDFGATLDELFFDYGTPGLFSVRAGQVAIAWGNARILSAADLPGRTVNTTALAPDVDIRPAWLTSTNPSLWIKATEPLGSFTLTGLAGAPNETITNLRQIGYGGQLELVTGKSYLNLSGYYKGDKTPRAGFTAKTSVWGIDLFLDSSVSFPNFPVFDYALPVITGGLYFQTNSGPDIRLTAELRYNGENVPGRGYLVADALPIGGLSQAVALAWTSIGGSSLSLGGTWYQSWADCSGAVVPILSINIAPLVTIRFIFPWVYGKDGSDYRANPPAESDGFAAGIGILLVMKTNF